MKVTLPAVQHYAWGTSGNNSMVAKVQALATGKPVIVDKPSAELWMGTHPSGPSMVEENGKSITLREYLNKDLPYLFKVLSVQTALSVQAHPDFSLAQKLHKDKPDMYKDPHAKPEMAVALSPFECMCAFRPISEIRAFIKDVPELRALLGEAICAKFLKEVSNDSERNKTLLRDVFTALMTADANRTKEVITELVARLGQLPPPVIESNFSVVQEIDVNELVVRLNKQYPGDIGVLCPYFLNCLRCPPGQGVFLEPQVPHAYLSGDILECMGPSDNVVRAGLTPKLRDTDVLCAMLTYECGKPHILTGDHVKRFIRLYQPPAPHHELNTFRLLSVDIDKDAKEPVKVGPLPTHAMLLVTEGSGTVTVDNHTQELRGGLLMCLKEFTEFSITHNGGGVTCHITYASNYLPCGARL